MKLTILGSGTYVPELDRFNASYLLETDKATTIFDFGRGAMNQLLKSGRDLRDIDAIFISHLHPDHYSEIVSLLNVFISEPKTYKRYKPIKIFGPDGWKNSYDKIIQAFKKDLCKIENEIIIEELADGSEEEIEDLKIKAFEVIHSQTKMCLAYRAESDGKVFTYSGDSSYCDALIQACKNADVALVEATFPPEKEKETHLTGVKAGKIAKEANVKKLLLTHISGTYLKDAVDDAKKEFDGDVKIAEQLMEIDI